MWGRKNRRIDVLEARMEKVYKRVGIEIGEHRYYSGRNMDPLAGRLDKLESHRSSSVKDLRDEVWTELRKRDDIAALTKAQRKEYVRLTNLTQDDDGNVARYAYKHEEALNIIKECACE